MTRTRGPRPNERQPDDAWYGPAAMDDQQLLSAMNEAIARFEADKIIILSREGKRMSQDPEWWDSAIRRTCDACPPHHRDQVPAVLDALMLGAGETTAAKTLNLIRDDSIALRCILRTQNQACEAWAKRKQLVIGRNSLHNWIDNRIAHMATFDPFAEAGWMVERSNGKRFDGVVVALAVLRGENHELLGELLNQCRMADNAAISEGIATVLYRRIGDNALEANTQITPSLDGLAWLGRHCPGRALIKGANSIMMDDENIDYLIKPLIAQMKAAPAQLEAIALDANTAAAPGKRGGIRL